MKRERNNHKVRKALEGIRNAAEEETRNLMPLVLDAVKEYATIGEICGVLREVFGEHKPSTVF